MRGLPRAYHPLFFCEVTMPLSKERLTALKNEIVMAEKLNEEELEPMVAEALERYKILPGLFKK